MLHKSIILYLKVIDLDTYQAAPPPTHTLCRRWNGAHFPTVACKGGGDLIKSPLLIF